MTINQIQSKVLRKLQVNNTKNSTVLQYDSPYNMKTAASDPTATKSQATPSFGPSDYITVSSSPTPQYFRRPVELDSFQSYSRSISASQHAHAYSHAHGHGHRNGQVQTQAKSTYSYLLVALVIFFIITVYISRRRINHLEQQLKKFQRNRINASRNVY